MANPWVSGMANLFTREFFEPADTTRHATSTNAIQLDPGQVSARMNLGNTLLRRKQYAAAIDSYRQVQRLARLPNDVTPQ